MIEEPELFAAEPAVATETDAPLAHRLRPESLSDYLGHEQLLGPGKPLREAIESGTIGSMVLWGPPGCGKTTLARLLAHYTDKEFVTFSAVTEGVPRVREIIREAEQRRRVEQRGTILFCNEIHRFNRAQQDAFLPSVEAGVITLIGATTENPYFSLNTPLLSRCLLLRLEALEADDLKALILHALRDEERGLGGILHHKLAQLEDLSKLRIHATTATSYREPATNKGVKGDFNTHTHTHTHTRTPVLEERGLCLRHLAL